MHCGGWMDDRKPLTKNASPLIVVAVNIFAGVNSINLQSFKYLIFLATEYNERNQFFRRQKAKPAKL